MKQVLIKKGRALSSEVPPPMVQPGMIRVRVHASCISPGTEAMGIAASGKSLLQKAIAQPDKARKAWARMRKEGIASVLRKAQSQQEEARPIGYSAAGTVLEVGDGADEFQVGQRVAIAGAAYAHHAAEAVVPVNLAIPMPEGLSFDEAGTVALGAIALQGVRRSGLQLGENAVVLGCGALGLLALQMLKAAGCRVAAVDVSADRLEEARSLGADLTCSPEEGDAVRRVTQYFDGRGADAILITAATRSNAVLSQAFQMARTKGRVVLVGVVGPEFNREEMYAKELDLVISTSYGPGRYDEQYERWGADYPYGYVRWTERRNMDAYLRMLSDGRVQVRRLISGTVSINEADAAYERLKGPDRPLLMVFHYDAEHPAPVVAAPVPPVDVRAEWTPPPSGAPVGIAVVGAGQFMKSMHLPYLASLKERVAVRRIVDQAGHNAVGVASKFPGCQAATDPASVWSDPAIHAVLIGTRHDTHAELAFRALEAGKAVFVEKPMALTPGDFARLQDAIGRTGAPYLVGYNRRFSPMARSLRKQVQSRVNPLMLHYTMNAGYIPYTHWTQTHEGGGRIMGEGCHIIDLFRYLVGHPVESLHVEALRPATAQVRPNDNCVITLRYSDGSVATLLYTAVGNAGASKERLEAFWDEKAAMLDDYVRMTCHGAPGGMELKKQDKGHASEMDAFLAACRGEAERLPIPWDELENTWQATWQADRMACGSVSADPEGD